MHRRILKLAKARYLESTCPDGAEGHLAYSLSKKSLRECIGKKGTLSREQRKSASPKHDLELLGIRRWLIVQGRVLDFYPENGISNGIFDKLEEIEALKSLRSDAIVRIDYGGKEILLPLEFDASEKFSSRYERIVKRYYHHPHVEAVLFLASDRRILEKVQRAEKQEDPPHRFFYLHWKGQNETSRFTNLEGIELNLSH